MKKMFAATLTALALVSVATPAAAQSLRGVRGDVSIAADRFKSEGHRDNQIGWGASAGVDFFLTPTVVAGVEGTFLNSRAENVGRDGPGIAARKSFEEWGGAVRLGVMASPSTLIYAKGGVAWNEQRKLFVADTDPVGSYYNHYRTRGWVAGAGVEHMLSDRFYVKAEGRYANYRTNSSRITGLLGLGVLFGPSRQVAEYVAPVAAPVVEAPMVPQTQTCADGSVILATDVCPQPLDIIPPPPMPGPERG